MIILWVNVILLFKASKRIPRHGWSATDVIPYVVIKYVTDFHDWIVSITLFIITWLN